MAIKKHLVLLITLITCSGLLLPDLIDVYRKGTVHLVPSPEFGKNTDWEEYIYYKVRYIAVAANGCVFISNGRQHKVYKFDSKGNFLKTFGEKGLGPGDLMGPSRLSILDNMYLVVNEDLIFRRISIFDLEGNFVRLIKTDWSVYDCTALRDDKIALLTENIEVIGNNRQVSFARVFVCNIHTGEEMQVLKRKMDLIQTQTNSDGSKTHYFENIFLLPTNTGNFLLGFNNNPDITIYSPEGKILKSFNLKLTQQKITSELKMRRYNIMVKKALINPYMPQKYRKEYAKNLIRDKRKILREFPGYYPYYEDLIIDSDDNILVLKNRYIDETDWRWTPIYQVYSLDGDLKCEFAVDFGNYDTKTDIGKVFFNDFLYGIFEKETEDDLGFELVKIQLK